MERCETTPTFEMAPGVSCQAHHLTLRLHSTPHGPRFEKQEVDRRDRTLAGSTLGRLVRFQAAPEPGHGAVDRTNSLPTTPGSGLFRLSVALARDRNQRCGGCQHRPAPVALQPCQSRHRDTRNSAHRPPRPHSRPGSRAARNPARVRRRRRDLPETNHRQAPIGSSGRLGRPQDQVTHAPARPAERRGSTIFKPASPASSLADLDTPVHSQSLALPRDHMLSSRSGRRLRQSPRHPSTPVPSQDPFGACKSGPSAIGDGEEGVSQWS